MIQQLRISGETTKSCKGKMYTGFTNPKEMIMGGWKCMLQCIRTFLDTDAWLFNSFEDTQTEFCHREKEKKGSLWIFWKEEVEKENKLRGFQERIVFLHTSNILWWFTATLGR